MSFIHYITATLSEQHHVLVKHNGAVSDFVVNSIKYTSQTVSRYMCKVENKYHVVTGIKKCILFISRLIHVEIYVIQINKMLK
jgi:hypothetical protein